MSIRSRNQRRRRKLVAAEMTENEKRLRRKIAELRDASWEEIATAHLIYYLRTWKAAQKVGEYGIVARSDKIRCHAVGEASTICWDAVYGLVLACNGLAVACISFNLIGDKAVVVQIQGRKEKERYLRSFPWYQMLLGLVVALAKEAKLHSVELVPGHRNKWQYVMRPGSLHRLYNKNAGDMGFSEPRSLTSNYSLRLS